MMTSRSLWPLFVTLFVTLFVAASAARASAEEPTKTAERYVCPPCGSDCHDETFDAPGSCSVCGMTLVRESTVRNVAIVVWNGAEVLDFTGPAEVYAASSSDAGAFRVYTVASSAEPIVSQGFLNVVPNYSIADCPAPDIVVLPGGGTGSALEDAALMKWLADVSKRAEYMTSVCTGAFLLARIGLLDGKTATTWHGAVDRLRELAPRTKVVADARVVDNGSVLTSAGVSAGIDGALYLVSRLHGEEAARRTARYMEYDWRPERLRFVRPASVEGTERLQPPAESGE